MVVEEKNEQDKENKKKKRRKRAHKSNLIRVCVCVLQNGKKLNNAKRKKKKSIK